MLWTVFEIILSLVVYAHFFREWLPGSMLLEVLFGAVLAIITTIILDSARLPKLSLELTAPLDMAYEEPRPSHVRFLLVNLVNAPLPQPLRWLSRNPALNARGTVTFHQLADDKPLFRRAMRFRWSGSDEPLPLVGRVWNMPARLWDQRSFLRDSVVDVYPGGSESFGIAARIEDDTEAYAWSNESYLASPKWRHAEWKIPAGNYRVRVSVSSSGKECLATYLLRNEGPWRQFRIETMPETETRRTPGPIGHS